MDFKHVWQLVQEDLQVSLSQPNYTAWIKPAQLLSLAMVGETHQIAEIGVSSTFHQKIIEGRYYAQVKEAFDRITKKQTEIKLVVVGGKIGRDTVGVEGTPLFTAIKPQLDDYTIAQHHLGLNEVYTFDSFAVSSSNEMAHAAALAVSQSLGMSYNPLFLYGGVGVGKTHLMQAIAHNALKQDPTAPLLYCSGEEFTNEIIDAIQQKTTREFRRRYRKVRGLFIDDIQFIAGKATVQEEFFHTFNSILKTGGQVVMTSDRSPEEIGNLEDRLRSRFEGGLLIDIGTPNFELRTAILLIKAKQRNIHLPMEAAQAVAASMDSTRKLEGFLTRLVSESRQRALPITIEMVQGILGTKASGDSVGMASNLRPLEVVRVVCDYFRLPEKDVRGPRRAQPIVLPRQLAMFLLRVDMKLPFTEIGGLFGGRDHTTVMHSIDKISREITVSDSMRVDIENLRKQLRETV